ncbi:NUDIX domain-containing protein [Caballeronia mineralivorans]|jgi:8-oxo-dGTP diphosphatase|uniref:NUDIX hydrolase n=2 Tax=Caballeronia mineralivorans TaxID=2010198 RepID=UPI003211DA6E
MNLMPESPSVIRVAAALLIGGDGRMLLVRERGTLAFLQPGGKIEQSEEPICALVRQLREELGLVVQPSQAVYLGRFRAPAVNEPGWTVEAELFKVNIEDEVAPAAEIDEVVWIDSSAPTDLTLAPLTRDFVLPLYKPPASARSR